MIKVVSDIQIPTIMRRRGLDTSGKARKYLAARIIQRADRYTPKQTGTLKNTAQILWDGRMIRYSQYGTFFKNVFMLSKGYTL